MFDWLEIIRLALKVIFWGILPAIIFYYRYKKKVTTSFAIGSVLTCFIFGVLSIATVEEDPVEKFVAVVNSKNYEESKKSYKVLVQYGPEYLEKLKDSEIVDLQFFKGIKSDIIREYKGIAEGYNNTVKVEKIDTCDKLSVEEKKFQKLHHAVLLLNYAETIGADFKDLKKSLKKQISNAEVVMAENQKVCD